VISTASAEALAEPEIQHLSAGILRDMDAQLCQYLKASVKAGALSGDADIKALTFLLTASVHSIGLRARAGNDRKALKRMADALLNNLLPRLADQAKA